MKIKSDLATLRYFLAVVESGSYSRAASAMRVTQPAVSRQVQSLERSYNTRLFRREGRRLEVTEAGKQLVIESQAILARFDALHDVIGIASREPSGLLSVGSPWVTGESMLPQVLGRFRQKYPKVFVRLVQDSTDRLADALVARDLDIAVLYHRPRRSELEFVPLMEIELGLIAPTAEQGRLARRLAAREEMTLLEVSRLPLILPQKGQVLRDLIEGHCERQGVAANIVMESDSFPLSKSLVLAGHGYTIVAFAGVYDEVRRSELRFIRIRSPSIPWRMCIATSKHHLQTLALKAMKRELTDFARSSAPAERWKGRAAG
ncbi:MAG: LysR family transcriptional regulator [Burkholderiaceae bacterium]